MEEALKDEKNPFLKLLILLDGSGKNCGSDPLQNRIRIWSRPWRNSPDLFRGSGWLARLFPALSQTWSRSLSTPIFRFISSSRAGSISWLESGSRQPSTLNPDIYILCKIAGIRSTTVTGSYLLREYNRGINYLCREYIHCGSGYVTFSTNSNHTLSLYN